MRIGHSLRYLWQKIVQAPEKYILHQQTLWLSPYRSMYWENQEALVVSDLHFGKTGHFRKSGIAVPQAIYKEDLQTLATLIQYFKPKKLIVVGDFFHSVQNKELDYFARWRNDFASLPIHLVKGNHDILHQDWYSKTNITIANQTLVIDKFCFVHDIAEIQTAFNENLYYISGHIHPGINVKGLGRQSLTFPCFYFSPQYAILPAFSKFTGYVPIKKKKTDTVYAILPVNTAKGQMGSLVKM